MRSNSQLQAKQWEVTCPNCGEVVFPVATRESKPLQCSSIYALSKKDQEEMVLLFGRTYQIPAVALRYFNIFGTRQSLSNPYTGVVAIFASRLMNGNSPVVFEDGSQLRDFVNVHDIVQANLRAMEPGRSDYEMINIGTGTPTSVNQIAQMLAEGLGKKVPARIVGKFREGDIRHCVADITKAKKLLGYEPAVQLKKGIPDLLAWVGEQRASDRTASATAELEQRNLVR